MASGQKVAAPSTSLTMSIVMKEATESMPAPELPSMSAAMSPPRSAAVSMPTIAMSRSKVLSPRRTAPASLLKTEAW